MKTWDDYLDGVRPWLPECPDVLMRHAVKDAAIEFCDETECWIETADIVVVPNEREIPFASLTVPNTVVPVSVLWLGNADGDIEPRTPRWLTRNRPAWRYDDGSPEFFTMPVRGTVLVLTPHPTETLALDAEVAVKPSDIATEGPDDLYEDYKKYIQSGAISMLADIPGKPWTNPALVEKSKADFQAGKDKAVIRATRGNTRAPIRSSSNFRF